MARILHVLSQRPGLTGSGVTIQAIVDAARRSDHVQEVICAAPEGEPAPVVAGVRTHALYFETTQLPFSIPGMSDVMPYRSRRFSSLSADELAIYESAWKHHISSIARDFTPDLIHCHHLWLVGSWMKDLFPAVPVVSHCHGTGLRQLELCPDLAEQVRRGCSRNERILALSVAQKDDIMRLLDVAESTIRVVGAGYQQDIFVPRVSTPSAHHIAFAGKIARAKGLDSLLEAVANVASRRSIRLSCAGGGSGPEADSLRERMTSMTPTVEICGRLDQESLADLLRRSSVFVLPSMFEGLPLVLIEAAASGCRLIATDLPGVRELSRNLGQTLQVIPLPDMLGIDEPAEDSLPAFVLRLEQAIEAAIDAGPMPVQPSSMNTFTWGAVFERIEQVYNSVL